MPKNVKPRNVSLTLENEAFITERVASGRFGSASEVVRAALRLLKDDERRRAASDVQPEALNQAGHSPTLARG